jgi:hypothetical protein
MPENNRKLHKNKTSFPLASSSAGLWENSSCTRPEFIVGFDLIQELQVKEMVKD